MLHQKIFIASPGDVCDERGLARGVIERIRSERAFRGRVDLECVAWDQPGAGVAMEALMTPQEAIARGLPKPSECDIVVVILWSRIGTRLPPEYTKADGSRYVSGTEWEFLDALDAARRAGTPVVWHTAAAPHPPFGPTIPTSSRRSSSGTSWSRFSPA